MHVHSTNLQRGDHGAEGKDSCTVLHCGLVVKGTLSVQQEHCHLHTAHDNAHHMLTVLSYTTREYDARCHAAHDQKY